VALEASDRGPVRRLFGSSTFVYLGRISYGTYLWHWLVVVVLSSEADVSPLTTAAVSAVVATGIASLSYQLLEQPIRRAGSLDPRPVPVVALGLTMSLVVGLIATPAILDRNDTKDFALAAEPTIVGG